MLDQTVTQSQAPSEKRVVNADSFRRLSALLKKPAGSPATIPNIAVQAAPVIAAPQPAPIVVTPPIAAAPVAVVQPTEPAQTLSTTLLVDAKPAETIELVKVQELAPDALAQAQEVQPVAPVQPEPSFGISASAVAALLNAKAPTPAPIESPKPVSIEAAAPAQPEQPAGISAASVAALLNPKPAAAPQAIELPAIKVEAVAAPQLIEQPVMAPELVVENLIEQPLAVSLAPTALEEAIPLEQTRVIEVKPAAETVAAKPVQQAHLEQQAPVLSAQPRVSRLQKKAQDAFSMVMEAPVEKPVPAPVILTPEQEIEKSDLARSLLDMMAAGSGQPHERALAADTLLRMLHQLPSATRKTIAERVAMMEQPSPFLIGKLLNDPEIAVSGPLIENCAQLSDDALFQVIQDGDQAKLRLLARRRRISPPIAEELAKVKDHSVLMTLLRNQGAEITQDGFAAASAEAMGDPELLAPLCTRPDLPVHFAFEVIWAAPPQLRRYLLNRFLTDSENLTKILRITMGDAAEAEAPAIGLAEVGTAVEQIMSPDPEAGIATLALAAKINRATVEKILGDKQGEPLMALFKCVGVPRSELESNLQGIASGAHALIDPARDLSEVQAVFDQLSFTKARILLTYWDWAVTKSGPYAPHH